MKPKRKAKSKSKPKSEPKPPIAMEAESPSEFAFAIARTAVAQICQSVGFTSAHLSALHTLTAVAAAYLQAAAKSSAALAAAANRTDSNLLDLSAALHDLRSGAALSAASSAAADRCLLRSSALADVIAFAQSTPETPFAKPVPQRHCRPNSSPGERGPIRRPPHVPHWLPEAPARLAAAERRERGRGGGGEELWEDRVGVGRSGIGVEMGLDLEERERDGKLGFVLREERERVRFKMGLRREREKGVCWDSQKIGFKKNGGCVGVVEGE